ncbi:MAG: 1-pyrroline-5-carboxylate dehydrogenase, partial [Bacteroidetes bacterium]|nr:1-pyrroline-5-carboxylate dehydrogenase [Bacteroidota bacterium]
MANAIFNIPLPPNEPVKNYVPGSPERSALKLKLDEMQKQEIDIPIIIGGKEIRTSDTDKCVMP